MSVLHGGAAESQLDYVEQGFGRGGKEEDDDENYRDTRAEAKSAHASRMAALEAQAQAQARDRDRERERDEKNGSLGQGQVNGLNRTDFDAAEAKGGHRNQNQNQSQGRLVGDNTPPRRADSKGQQLVERGGDGYRLLGDLPGLGRDRAQQAADVKVALSLELPGEGRVGSNQGLGQGQGQGQRPAGAEPKRAVHDDGIPPEYKCAINGHVMKEPVRCLSSGIVFERATIELWLSTRGSVCPITNQPLDREDLQPADDLKNRIKRFHITQTSMRTAAKQEDDLYDF
jgi:hypothetical protein